MAATEAMNTFLMNLSTTLVFLGFGSWLSALITRKISLRWVIVTVVVILSLVIPVVDSNSWLWMNGATGVLSFPALILLTGYVIKKLTRLTFLFSSTRRQLYILILLSGVLLYPATLGLIQFDPYILGYSFELSFLLLALSVMYWIIDKRQVSVILLIVVAASVVGVSSSQNTWDYFIDPLLWLFSPVLLFLLLRNKQRTTIFS